MASFLVSKRQYEGVYAYWQLDISPDKNFFIHRDDLSIRELVGVPGLEPGTNRL